MCDVVDLLEDLLDGSWTVLGGCFEGTGLCHMAVYGIYRCSSTSGPEVVNLPVFLGGVAWTHGRQVVHLSFSVFFFLVGHFKVFRW